MNTQNKIAQEPLLEPVSAKTPTSSEAIVEDALKKSLNKVKPELDDEAKTAIHQAGEDFEKSMQKFEPQPKDSSENILTKLKKQPWVHWVNDNLFADNCLARKALSLENELAEAMDPTFDQLKAPKWLRNGFYRVLWTMTFVTTGFRSLYEAINEEKWVAGLKKVTQDGVSVVALTTLAARIMNTLQEKLYNGRLPLVVKNMLRPALTIGGCIKGIKYFDMVGEPAGDYVVKMAEKLFEKTQNTEEKMRYVPSN